jgi:cytochrome c biogenesis DsbD-like protein
VISILLLGIAAGVSHVITGPDHVAALAPFSVEAQRSAWSVGLRWGIGHALGIVAVALVFVLAADRLNVQGLAGLGNDLVGAVLIAVGIWGLRHGRRASETFERESRAGAHGHGHVHRHVHATAALSIGTLHGLVGTGSTLAVLPAVGMRTLGESAVYLSGFAAGTVLSMSGVAWLLGMLAPRDELGSAYRRVFRIASLGSLALGVVWLGLALAGLDVHGG